MTGSPCEKASDRFAVPRETILRSASDHMALEELTDRIWACLNGAAMDDRTRFELKLIIHEALINAAEHGNGSDPSKYVTVICRVSPHQVEFVVEDEGRGFKPDRVPDCTAPENLLRESGRGTFLIHHLADECRYEDHGRRTVVVKRF
jgi:serine/threonine-protein kinase RsbW